MKNIFLILLMAAAMLMVSCKTTEKNYRTAYEVAKANDRNKLDSETEKKIEAEKFGQETKIDGDSVNMKTEYVQLVEIEQGEDQSFPEYNVAVGYFKQVFNARMFKKRLKSKSVGAYILLDSQKQYYVIAAGFDDPKEAAKYIRNIGDNIPFKLPIEPFIVIKAL